MEVIEEKFEQFTVYSNDVSKTFLYINFSNPDAFMDGLSDHVLSETNLLNFANTMSPIHFTPSAVIYKKIYSTLGTFLNTELELLMFGDVSD